MATHSPAVNEDDASMLVNDAAQAYMQATQLADGKGLTAALLTLERTAKQTRLVIPPEALFGTWRLCFSAGKKAKYQSGQPIGSGFYIPRWAIARIAFAPQDGPEAPLTITNELSIGSFKIRFTGPARYPGKKNLLVFDFTQLEVSCWGLKLYRGAVGRRKWAGQAFSEAAIAKLPFFSFFAATDNYIAARGRGGGLAIWVKASA